MAEGDKYIQKGSTTDPVKPASFDKYVQQPLTREAGRGLLQQGSFQGDSNYDQGLVYGVDQMALRARNQPWYDQVANSAAKLVPAIALGITENAGYLGELFSNDQDYTNTLTEFAQQGRQALEDRAPIYRQNPDQVIDWKDSGWWIQNGEGLAESIGEFLVTGAAVGGAAGSAAKLLNNVLKAGKTVTALTEGAAQLGTASTLAYTEGAMSGAQVFKDVYESELSLHGDIDEARRKAGEAASTTVKLNTIINTGLNITSVSPLFQNLNNLYQLKRLGVARQANESLATWLGRLDVLEKQGVKQASIKKTLASEALQEGLEEQVNLFAEGEGRIVGGIEKPTSDNPLGRFLNKSFTDEGLLNFVLGAVGGVVQTAGMEYIPYQSYVNDKGETVRTNNRTLNQLQDNATANSYIASLRNDIKYVIGKQQELDNALSKGDSIAADKARRDMFNVATLRSIRRGVGEEFEQDLRAISNIDNVAIGEDGKTEAMRQGLAESPTDNEYKQEATKKIQQLKELSTNYNFMRQMFGNGQQAEDFVNRVTSDNEFVRDLGDINKARKQINKTTDSEFLANEVFRRYLDVRSAQDHYDNLQAEVTENSAELYKTVTNVAHIPGVELEAEIKALEAIAGNKNSFADIAETINKRLVTLKEQKALLKETVPSLEAELKSNAAIVNGLARDKYDLNIYGERLTKLKEDYNKLLGNTEEIKKLLKEKNDIAKAIKEEKARKVKQQEKEKEEADLTKANEVKKQVIKKEVENHTVVSSKDGGFNLVENDSNIIVSKHSSVEEAEKAIPSKTEPTPITGEEQIEIPVTITPSVNQIEPYGKTEEDKKTEEELLVKTVIANNEIEGVTRTGKVAYRARETDNNPINPQYLYNHSTEFQVNSSLVISIDRESPFYKETQTFKDIPMVIKQGDHVIGYVSTVVLDSDKELIQLRERIFNSGSIDTKVAVKTVGVLNRQAKQTVTNAMPVINTLAIGKNGQLMIGLNNVYQGAVINTEGSIKDGITYAVVSTPNGKEIAIPLDTKKLSPKIKNSIMAAFKIFLYADQLLEEEVGKIEEIYNKYDIDLRTATGFKAYFEQFLYDFNLGDSAVIQDLNDNSDKAYINFTGNGIRYLTKGKAIVVNGRVQAKEIGKNTPEEAQEALLRDLTQHLDNLYYNVDLLKLQENAPLRIPILTLDNEELNYVEVNAPNYQSYIKSITDTNVVGEHITDTNYTYFVQPTIYFDTSFLGQNQQNNNGLPPTKTAEKVILAPEPVKEKVATPLKSKARRLPNTVVDSEQVDDITTQERKDLCE